MALVLTLNVLADVEAHFGLLPL
ncbi:hypothetical protein IL54_1136 [Sphingobium sp. ba1]|nr:hypothetical protein IL54_1136 [Sphingobium sp. ba1]